MKSLMLLSRGIFIYKYIAINDFASFSIYVSEYHSGKLVNKEQVLGLGYEDIGISILEDVAEKEFCGRKSSCLP